MNGSNGATWGCLFGLLVLMTVLAVMGLGLVFADVLLYGAGRGASASVSCTGVLNIGCNANANASAGAAPAGGMPGWVWLIVGGAVVVLAPMVRRWWRYG